MRDDGDWEGDRRPEEGAVAVESADLDRFRALLLADRALQRTLAAVEDGDAFLAAARHRAARAGIALDRAALLAAIEPDPLGLDRFAGPQASAHGWPDPAWLPVDIVAGASEWLVVWAHFAGMPLREPFFEESRRRAVRRPINRLLRYRTPLAALVATMPADVREPDGFVYHLSRCGSTLVAQMIAALPGARVVSESPALDAIVQLVHTRPDIPAPERVALLRAMVAAYGRGVVGPFVLKLDSWHARSLPLFRAAFPHVPAIFLFRDPVEILVSQARMRGLQTVPGALPPDVYGIPDGHLLSPEDYCALVLARVCDAVLAEEAVAPLAIDYADLPAAVEARILPHFGIRPDTGALAPLRVAGGRDAKVPGMPFADDRAAKQAQASGSIRAAADRHLAARIDALKRFGARRCNRV